MGAMSLRCPRPQSPTHQAAIGTHLVAREFPQAYTSADVASSMALAAPCVAATTRTAFVPSYSSCIPSLELGNHVFPDLAGARCRFDAGKESEDLVAARTAAGAELEAPLRDVIEHRDALGNLGGMIDLW